MKEMRRLLETSSDAAEIALLRSARADDSDLSPAVRDQILSAVITTAAIGGGSAALGGLTTGSAGASASTTATAVAATGAASTTAAAVGTTASAATTAGAVGVGAAAAGKTAALGATLAVAGKGVLGTATLWLGVGVAVSGAAVAAANWSMRDATPPAMPSTPPFALVAPGQLSAPMRSVPHGTISSSVSTEPPTNDHHVPLAAAQPQPAADAKTTTEPSWLPVAGRASAPRAEVALVAPHPGPSSTAGAPHASEPTRILAEVALLDRARDALRRGAVDLAQEALEEHERQFPSSSLRSEAELLWIRLLVARDQRPAALTRARRLMSSGAGTPYVRPLEKLLPELSASRDQKPKATPSSQ